MTLLLKLFLQIEEQLDNTVLHLQKSPATEAKEAYYRGKKDLIYRQKRPTVEAKETYYRERPHTAL